MKIDQIDYALVAKTHPSMYLMHKYWARKPCNVVSEYIKHYSKKGDIVLDPFAGSGVTAIESIKLDRKAIAVDLDPMSSFITRMTGVKIDLDKFNKEFEKIRENVEGKINDFFLTTCEKCKKKVFSDAVVWDEDKPEKIRYLCKCSKNRLWKEVEKEDLGLIKKIENQKIPYWYPKNDLIWNSRVNVHQNQKVYELFSKRNLLSLSMILHEINKISNTNIKNLMKFTFTSSLAQASKMVPYQQGLKTGGQGWKVRGYWVPKKRFEMNPWRCFSQRFKKVLRGKQESNSLIKEYNEVKNFDELKNGNILIKNYNTLEIEKIIPPNSIDYIFTDPPYGDAVPYLEIDYMWSSWLNFNPDFEDEIIVSDSPVRGKDDEIYERMLKVAFRKIFNLLKPGRWMTVTFHNTKIKYWNAILNACVYAGFEMEKIIYQPPAHRSSKSMLHPYGSAVGDYYIRFKKPKTVKLKTKTGINELRYKKIILEVAKRIIAERGEPSPYTHILNGIIVELKKEGALLTGYKNPDEVMKEYLNKEFVLVPIKNENEKVIGNKWWFKNPDDIPYLELVPLSDRVEIAIVDVLRRKVKVSFDDILQEIFIKFPNALTPETQGIKDLLKEYAAPTKDKNWMLKQEVKIRESEHSKMIYYLGKLGKKAGFEVWIGIREQSDVFENTKLSELITKEPNFRFIPTLNRDRVKQIDVIWHDEGRIKYEFEVENTTAITEAVIRGSNIPHDEIERIIVIPKERESLLSRKLKDPALHENIKKYGWKFTFYDDIEKLFNKHRRKKKLEERGLKKIWRDPKQNWERQNSIDIYLKK